MESLVAFDRTFRGSSVGKNERSAFTSFDRATREGKKFRLRREEKINRHRTRYACSRYSLQRERSMLKEIVPGRMYRSIFARFASERTLLRASLVYFVRCIRGRKKNQFGKK